MPPEDDTQYGRSNRVWRILRVIVVTIIAAMLLAWLRVLLGV